MATIVLMAKESGQGAIFTPVAEVLRAHGHIVHEFLALDGDFVTPESTIREALKGAHLAMVGFGNFPKAGEDLARLALEAEIPLGFLCNDFDSWRNRHFEKIKDAAVLAIRDTSENMPEAQEYFSKAKVVCCPNPLWEAWDFQPFSRRQVRARLRVPDETTLCVVALDKFPGENFAMLNCLIEAVGLRRDAPWGKDFRIVAGFHRGDKLARKMRNVYEEFSSRSSVPLMFLSQEILPTAAAVIGADVVLNALSTIGFQAAYERLPVICDLSTIKLDTLRRDMGVSVWAVCEAKAAYAFHHSSPLMLAKRLDSCFNEHERLIQRQYQERTFPRHGEPKRGRAAESIAASIESAL